MDKGKSDIEKDIQNAFGNVQRKAPDLWSDIKSDLNVESFEGKMQEGFNAQDKQAPDSGWSKVKRQLIIDDVWSLILAKLERRKRRIAFFWWSTAFLALFFLVGGSIYLYQQTNEGEILQSENKNASIETQKTMHQPNSEKEVSYDDQQIILNDKTDNQALVVTEVDNPGYTYTPLSDLPFFNDKRSSTEQQVLSDVSSNSFIEKPTFNIEDLYMPLAKKEFLQEGPIDNSFNRDLESSNIPFVGQEELKRFEIGITSDVNNSWILNNDVRNGMQSNSLILNKFSVGYSFGVDFIYYANANHAITANIDALSIYNQTYNFYQNGRYNQNQIQLKSHNIALGYRYRFNDNAYNKRWFVLNPGLYGAYISSVDEGQKSSLTYSNWSSFDFGISIKGGVQYHFGKLGLEYGLRTDCGLINLTADAPNYPKEFNVSTSLKSGIYARLFMRF